MSLIDTRYIVAPSIQTLFRDKDTGLPLSDGYVEFFRDVERTVHKPVYQLTGSPGNYSFTALPNPVPLNSIGTYSSNGADDILVYFFPYLDDGVTPDLYYAKVYSSDNVEQFDRQALPPNFSGSGETGTEQENFIANGQYTLHLIPCGDPDAVPPKVAGTITQPITNVAYGGWTFERPNTSADVDLVTFDEDTAYSDEPPNNPRFRIKVENQSAGGDSFKDLRVKFQNVHRFSSDTQFYTFGFNGQSESLDDVNITIMLYKYYGSGVGASLPSTTTITTEILTPADQTFHIPFIFGTNETKTVVGDDDFVQILIRFPTDVGFAASFTDMFLYKGNVADGVYPTTTTRQDLYRGIAGGLEIPDYTGMNLYLPVVLTPSGLDYSDADVGKIFPCAYSTPEIGELLCDGSQYETNNFSSDLIPYARLQQKLWISAWNAPLFGTGLEYFELYRSASGFGLLFNNGITGVVTATADGAATTGFSFRTVHQSETSFDAPNTDYGVNTGLIAANIVVSQGIQRSTVTNWSAGTAPVTITAIKNDPGIGTQYHATFTVQVDSRPNGGEYFTFYSLDPSIVEQQYYVWFTVNGAGADPAPGGHGVLCALETADTAAITAQKIVCAMQGVQATYIGTVAAASLTGGDYFICSATSAGGEIGYYVWYKIAGVGTDPAVANRTGIEVDLDGTETADQVLVKTQQAMNSKFFAVWDGRGKFIRGNDPTGLIDEGVRFSFWMVFGNTLGTDQYDENLFHNHTAVTTIDPDAGYFNLSGGLATADAGATTFTTASPTLTTEIGYQGASEARPYNTAFNWVIKY